MPERLLNTGFFKVLYSKYMEFLSMLGNCNNLYLFLQFPTYYERTTIV